MFPAPRFSEWFRNVVMRWSWLLWPAAAACECDPMVAAGVCTPGAFRCVDNPGEVPLEACDCGRRGGEITGCRYPAKWVKATGLCTADAECVERDDGSAATCVDDGIGPCTVGLTPERCIDATTALQCVQFIGPPVAGAGENQPGMLSEETCEPGFFCSVENGYAVCIMEGDG